MMERDPAFIFHYSADMKTDMKVNSGSQVRKAVFRMKSSHRGSMMKFWLYRWKNTWSWVLAGYNPLLRSRDGGFWSTDVDGRSRDDGAMSTVFVDAVPIRYSLTMGFRGGVLWISRVDLETMLLKAWVSSLHSPPDIPWRWALGAGFPSSSRFSFLFWSARPAS